jgi:hypothetical protein
MADKFDEIAKKRKQRAATLMNLQNSAKAAETAIQNHNQLAGVLKATQAVLKSVQD